jgi:hypothetical protein
MIETSPNECRDLLAELVKRVTTATDAELFAVSAALRLAVAALQPVTATIPERDAPSPEFWTAFRPDNFGIYAFADQDRAEQYASHYDGAWVERQTVMNCSAAGQFVIDSVGDDE